MSGSSEAPDVQAGFCGEIVPASAGRRVRPNFPAAAGVRAPEGAIRADILICGVSAATSPSGPLGSRVSVFQRPAPPEFPARAHHAI